MRKFQQKRPVLKSFDGPNTTLRTDTSALTDPKSSSSNHSAQTTSKIQFQIKKNTTPILSSSKQSHLSSQFGEVKVKESLQRIAITEISENKLVRADGVDENAKLVIPVDKNASWIDSKIKKKAENIAEHTESNTKLAQTVTSVEYGLNLRKKLKIAQNNSLKKEKIISFQNSDDLVDKSLQDLTLEQRAIAELLEETKPKTRTLVLKPEKTIESIADREKRQLKKDLDSLPDQVTEEDYDKVPVSEFGAALLRGMGWNDDLEDDKKNKHEKIRPSLLGLGAKPPPPELKLDKRLGFKSKPLKK
ncbi:hypothetical protein BB561_002774 [Smittium simulii]|uniref:Spp2/MOS2 G-patch domain-containing protein n=1 Tax=Smittium simulii TaxID=133385 RepID=A0A2T9YPA1_9FUNG|nr:hypothetical protein BB561_002774 [Smittium simulii]